LKSGHGDIIVLQNAKINLLELVSLPRRYAAFLANQQRAITELRMLRADLSEGIILAEIKRLASTSPQSSTQVLYDCIYLAAKGYPMPWEKE
jgi:hypothetical protein